MKLNSTSQISEDRGDYFIFGTNGYDGWQILDQHETLEEAVKAFGSESYLDQAIFKLVDVEIKEL